MMSNIAELVSSTYELEEIEKAEIALATYHNYVLAWAYFTRQKYTEEGAFNNKIRDNQNYNNITGGKAVTSELSDAFYRGKLTLRAMQSLSKPIKEYPHLAISANYWLPVQSYYAVHGMGKAAASALGRTPSVGHRAFCNVFSEILVSYFPHPFNIRCIGNVVEGNFSLENSNATIDEVNAISQLSPISTVEQSEKIIAKSIKTTRSQGMLDIIDKERSRIRNKSARRNLKKIEKLECCTGFKKPTSFCDFLYRLRLRANYHNPDMYVIAPRTIDAEIEYYGNLLYLTEVIVSGLDVIIRRCIGKAAMDTLAL